MKLAGRIFLLISGTLFLVWGIWDIISLIQKTSSVLASGDSSLVLSWVISLALNILEIIAGLGGIFYFIGKGPFKSWVGPLAIITLIFFILDIIVGGLSGLFQWISAASGVTAIIYFLGWIFANKK